MEDARVKLTQDFFKEDTFHMLIAALPSLDLELYIKYIYLWGLRGWGLSNYVKSVEG